MIGAILSAARIGSIVSRVARLARVSRFVPRFTSKFRNVRTWASRVFKPVVGGIRKIARAVSKVAATASRVISRHIPKPIRRIGKHVIAVASLFPRKVYKAARWVASKARRAFARVATAIKNIAKKVGGFIRRHPKAAAAVTVGLGAVGAYAIAKKSSIKRRHDQRNNVHVQDTAVSTLEVTTAKTKQEVDKKVKEATQNSANFFEALKNFFKGLALTTEKMIKKGAETIKRAGKAAVAIPAGVGIAALLLLAAVAKRRPARY